MKKLLKYTGISLLVLIILALLLPILFKGKIISLVKKEINQNLYAMVEFSDVDLSFFRRFPRVSLQIKDISVVGRDAFAKDTLLSAPTIDAAVNLLSFFRDEKEVYRVDFRSPRIHALVNENGKANWDIAIPDTVSNTDTASTSSAFRLKLKKYSISDGYILYRDEPSGMKAEISGLDHEGSGAITDEVFILHTTTESSAASFAYGGIPYLAESKASITSDLTIDNRNSKYEFSNSTIKVNNLELKTDGFFQLVNDSTYDMDIRFSAPSTEFKDLLSLIPAIYKTDFEQLKATGSARCKGSVKGRYSPVQMPAYDVNLEVADGFFQYPDLPKPVKNIQVSLKASNPDGDPDHGIIDLSKGHFEMDHEPFDLKLLYKNPETSQYIDAVAKGRIDLSQLGQFIKLEAGTKLAGFVGMDAFAKGNLSSLNQAAGNFTAGGMMDIHDLYYTSKDFPQPIKNGRMKVNLVNQGGVADLTTVNITEGHMEVGQNPVDFNFQLKNPMTTASFAGKARGEFLLDHVKQFTTLEPGTELSGQLKADLDFAGSKAAIDQSKYEQIRINGNAELNKVHYVSKDYPTGMDLNHALLGLQDNLLSLKDLNASYLGSKFTANGNFSNLVGYALKNETLKGQMNLGVDQMDLNKWMVSTDTSTTSTTSASAPFPVPANLDLTLLAKAGKVSYDKVDYSNISGTIQLFDETVKIKNVQADALDGNIIFNGAYSTRESKKQPDINMSYAVKDVSIQKAFMAFNTARKLMPVGQFLSGKLSSSLTMKGKLNGDLAPDLSSLTGNGNLLLLEGILKQFAPLEKIASTLNISELKSISLKDVKSYVEFSNGKVLVKPFTIKVKDIEMLVGGMHGMDQSLDYIVQMKLPRKYLGTQGNSLVNSLAAKANSKGIPVSLGETVNLSIRMGGTMSNPSMQTELREVAGDATKQMKEQAVDFAKQKIDSVKQGVKDTVNSIKKQAVAELKDEVKNRLLGNPDSSDGSPLDSTKKKTGEALKKTFNNFLKKKKE